MSGNDLIQRAKVIFGAIMVFFFMGIGLLFVFSPLFDHIEMTIRVIFGAAMGVYSLARGFQTYEQVREVFFAGHDDEDN